MFQEFKKSDKEKWLKKATNDLKGDNPYERFGWNFEDIALVPYYDREDITNQTESSLFSHRLLKNNDPSGDPRVWKNLQRIVVKNEKEANEIALEALNNGADGIDFWFADLSQIDFNKLLAEILMEHCHLSFSNLTMEIATGLLGYLNSLENHKVFHGTISIKKSSSEIFYQLSQLGQNLINYRLTAIDVGPNLNSTVQITSLLEKANQVLRSLVVRGSEINRATRSIWFSTNIGTDFFGEIAKIRALRNLYFQIARAYGDESFMPEDLHIRCISTSWSKEQYQPHANMLKGSTAGFAAIIGGCDSLVILSENEEEKMSTRIARNVSSILKEESFLSKTSDPVAGSYYLEYLTDEISKKAWEQFQLKVDHIA